MNTTDRQNDLSPFSTREQLMRHFSLMLRSPSTGRIAHIQYPYGSNSLTGLNPLWVFQTLRRHGPRCGPFMMYFDATNKCADRCPMCFTVEQRRETGFKTEIAIEKAFGFLDRTLALSPFLKSAVIGGPGEPLEYTHFREILEFLATRSMAIHIYSSGSSKVRAYADSILKYATLFRVSLDAATATTFGLTHGRSDFEARVESMRQLVALREQTGSPVILGLHFVVQKHNVDEIQLFAEMAKKLKVDYVEYVWESYYTVMGMTAEESRAAMDALAQVRSLDDGSFAVVTPLARVKHRLAEERTAIMTGAQVESHCFDLTGRLNFTVGGFVSLCAKERFNPASAFNLGEVSAELAERLHHGIQNGFVGFLPKERFEVGCSACFCNKYNSAMRTMVNFIEQNDDAEAVLIGQGDGTQSQIGPPPAEETAGLPAEAIYQPAPLFNILYS